MLPNTEVKPVPVLMMQGVKMVGANDEDAGPVDVSPPSKCTLRMLHHFAIQFRREEKNAEICNQHFVRGHEGAEDVQERFCTLRGVHSESITPARRGCLTAIPKVKTIIPDTHFL